MAVHPVLVVPAMKHPICCVVAAIASTVLVCSARAQESCKLTDMGTAAIAAVRDGRTLLLLDGREIRLAAIEITDDSASVLQSIVGTREVRIKRLGPGPDRYGRLVAFVYVGDSPQSVQQLLLAQGQARVSARIGDKGCADIMLDTERTARLARRGLWADPNFAPLRSENIPRIEAARGQFALVEGKVLSVRESGPTLYLNFGRRWTRDFTITIAKRHRREFADSGIDPKRLEGHLVRVRGWIEQRSGPVIEAATPEQLELVR